MKVFFNAIIIHTLLNLYVFWRGWKVIPPKKVFKIPYACLFGIELIIYLIGFFFYDSLSDDVFSIIYQIGMSWMIFIIYITMFLLVSDFYWMLTLLIPKLAKLFNPDSHKVRQRYFYIAFAATICIMIWGKYTFWHPQATNVGIAIHKQSPNIKNARIAVISDLHLGHSITKDVLHMYVNKVLEQQPDMILIVGDIIDYQLDVVRDNHFEEELSRLEAPLGVYAVTGNHDYYLNGDEKVEWLSQIKGVTLLRDTTILIDNSFYLVGREDSRLKNRKSLEYLLQNVDKKHPVIVMNHEPIYLDDEVKNGADIALYGHTHDGQFFPLNIALRFVYELSYGYKKKEDTHLFVTSGIGLGGPRYRVGTKSEILMLNVTFD